MFVCICNAITDRQIQEVVSAVSTSLSVFLVYFCVATWCGCCSEMASS